MKAQDHGDYATHCKQCLLSNDVNRNYIAFRCYCTSCVECFRAQEHALYLHNLLKAARLYRNAVDRDQDIAAYPKRPSVDDLECILHLVHTECQHIAEYWKNIREFLGITPFMDEWYEVVSRGGFCDDCFHLRHYTKCLDCNCSPKQSCNKHVDCKGKIDHCHDEDCEDCFGK